MPDDNSADERRNSWRFLVDASKSYAGREYGIYYDGKGKAAHLEAYAPDGTKVPLEPDAVIFAFDDERHFDNQNSRLQVTAFQIETGDKAQLGDIAEIDIDYVVLADEAVRGDAVSPGRVDAVYTITRESADEMMEHGIMSTFPKSFSADITALGADGGILRNADGSFQKTNPGFLANLSFPPFHPGERASVARAHIDETRPPAGFVALSASVGFNAAAAPPEPENPQISTEEFRAALEKYGVDITARARQGRGPVVAGREDEIQDVLLNLTLAERAAVCLIGDSGVGKSAIKDGVAQAIADGRCPPSLRNARVIEINLSDTQATKGAMWRGQVEKEVKALLDGNAERGGWLDGQQLIFSSTNCPSISRPRAPRRG